MTIAEVSKTFGLTADTLRYYERIGLIPPVKRSSSGIRDYDEKTGWTRILLKEPHNWGYVDKDSNVVIPLIFNFS